MQEGVCQEEGAHLVVRLQGLNVRHLSALGVEVKSGEIVNELLQDGMEMFTC